MHPDETDDGDISDPRAERLKTEFERMLALCSKSDLIQFWCADLSAEEGDAFLSNIVDAAVIENALPGFMLPQEFQKRYPGKAPEKYLVGFHCAGIERTRDGEIVQRNWHVMEVIFALDYPSRNPRFIWMTPIWHPNIAQPYLCIEGRPFPISVSLDQVCLEVGRMIQYQNYDVMDKLNPMAAQWAVENRDKLPVDTRNLVDGQVYRLPLVILGRTVPVEPASGETVAEDEVPLVEVLER